MSDATPLTRGDLLKALEALRVLHGNSNAAPLNVHDVSAALATLDEPTRCAGFVCALRGCEYRTGGVGKHANQPELWPHHTCQLCGQPFSAHQQPAAAISTCERCQGRGTVMGYGGTAPCPACKPSSPTASAALPVIHELGYYHGSLITLHDTARAYADALAEAQRECERLKEIDIKSNITFEQLHQEANTAEQECKSWRARAERAERERDEQKARAKEAERKLRKETATVHKFGKIIAEIEGRTTEQHKRALKAEGALKACVEALETTCRELHKAGGHVFASLGEDALAAARSVLK